MKPVAALFCRANSVYKTLPGVDVFDIERNALTFPGRMPVVAHPPCRAWGRLRWAAKPRPGERELAIRAVEIVRCWGGVLEHPKASRLWNLLCLPAPGAGPDRWGGFTLEVEQLWWGHSCKKSTWLYVCGCAPADVPAMPLTFAAPTKVVTSSAFRKWEPGWLPHCTKEERESTPPAFAQWLVDLAKQCTPPNT